MKRVIDKHQKKVAKKVLRTNDIFNKLLGGPSKKEAEKILKDKGGKSK